jgi:hypothetical protein
MMNEFDSTELTRQGEEAAKKFRGVLINAMRDVGCVKDGWLTAQGRFVVYYLIRELVLLLNRQGDKHRGAVDPEDTPTGFTLISWTLGHLMRIRKKHPKKPKEEFELEP